MKPVNAARCPPDPTGVRLPTNPTDSESPPINIFYFNIFYVLQIFTQLERLLTNIFLYGSKEKPNESSVSML